MVEINSQKTKEVWEKRVMQGIPIEDIPPEDYNCVRDVIRNSWERSISSRVHPQSTNDTRLPIKDFAAVRSNNTLLLETAEPYLDTLFKSIDNYLVQLCDNNGCVIKVKSDSPELQKLSNLISSQREGYVVSENEIGTGSTGVCMITQEPVEVVGPEHFQERNHQYHCCSAPIFDSHTNGNIIGILTIMCPVADYQSHTLGMVIAAANSIQKELQLKRALAKLEDSNSLLSSTIEAVNMGVFLLNSNNDIVLHNNLALQILKLPIESATGKSFFSLVKKESLPETFSQPDSLKKETNLSITNCNGKRIDVIMTKSLVASDSSSQDNFILTIDTERHAISISNKLSGYRASYTFDSMIGQSKALDKAKAIGKIAARSTSPVLILGESGTGKELMAQSIHNMSDRRDKPFVAINCGSIPKNLIESELFGAEYGAFTGAKSSGSPGKFELANGGTIFLDEIGEMPFDLQVAFLRVLQTQEITRLGGTAPKKIDVRIISATNQDLFTKMSQKTFREDLFYRLNVLNIVMPALRERVDDIELLAKHFVETFSRRLDKPVLSISTDALMLLLQHDWPGNVRELENIMERAVNICESNSISSRDLSDHLNANKISNSVIADSYPSYFAQDRMTAPQQTSHNYFTMQPDVPAEYQSLVKAISNAKGNVKQAAASLGIPTSTMYDKLRKYNIVAKHYKTF